MQEEDWTVDGAMTDVKGDRGISPVNKLTRICSAAL